MPRIIDLSQPVGEDTPVFPGDGEVRIFVSRIDLSAHTGTHIDAPFHFFDNGLTIDRVPLEQCVLPALLIDVRGMRILEKLEPHGEALRGVGAVVLHTGWSRQWGGPGYFDDHPYLTADAAQFLVECGVQLVGVDMPSIDRAPYPAHQVLLGAGVLIVENLTNLDAIGADRFQFIALPLKLSGRDASPVRAVAVL